MAKINLKNRTIVCRDNLDVLQGINSNSVDLIYLDPPFNKKKVFTAPIGSSAEGASFKDWFREEDVKDDWLKTIKEDHIELHNFLAGIKAISNSKNYLYNYCYLAYMAIRLIEMQRILKDTGSIYLHCDPTMGHYIKILMDCVFGEKNYRNEIVWKKSNSPKSQSNKWGEQHDVLFFYSKNKTFLFHKVYKDLDEKSLKTYTYRDSVGKFRTIEIVARGLQNYEGRKTFEFKGVVKAWLYSLEKLNEWWEAGLIHKSKNGNYRKKQYLKNVPGKLISDLFIDNEVNPIQGSAREYVGYPTQKPLALLERIIKASSNEGDVVLDPFCGCATTCVASEKLNRKWIGIDVSVKAYELVKLRLKKEVQGETKEGQTNLLDYEKEVIYTTAAPVRDGKGNENEIKKYVYVISHPSYTGEYKVGIAKDWKARLNSYQTSSPDRSYKIEYKLHTHLFREMEKFIHEKFENKHEWVRGDLKEIITAMKRFENE